MFGGYSCESSEREREGSQKDKTTSIKSLAYCCVEVRTLRPKKKKKCATCKAPFVPERTFQPTCSMPCAIKLVNKNKEIAYDKETKRMRENALTLSERLHKSEKSCNAFIRYRDKNEPCISCQTLVGQFHAGHYKSVGAYPELRFHPDNIHKQCAQCNNYQSSNTIEYRKNLIIKIGEPMVEWLEGPHIAQNYTKEDAIDINEYYKYRLKQLKNQSE